MDGYVLAWRWLAHGAVGGLIVLCLGSLAAWLCGQPVRRARIVVLTLVGAFAVPWLGALPLVPRWSAGIVLATPRALAPPVTEVQTAAAPALPPLAIDRLQRRVERDRGRTGMARTIDRPAATEQVAAEQREAGLWPSWLTGISWETLTLAAYVAVSLGWIGWWLFGQLLLWRVARAARPVAPEVHEVFRRIQWS